MNRNHFFYGGQFRSNTSVTYSVGFLIGLLVNWLQVMDSDAEGTASEFFDYFKVWPRFWIPSANLLD